MPGSSREKRRRGHHALPFQRQRSLQKKTRILRDLYQRLGRRPRDLPALQAGTSSPLSSSPAQLPHIHPPLPPPPHMYVCMYVSICIGVWARQLAARSWSHSDARRQTHAPPELARRRCCCCRFRLCVCVCVCVCVSVYWRSCARGRRCCSPFSSTLAPLI